MKSYLPDVETPRCFLSTCISLIGGQYLRRHSTVKNFVFYLLRYTVYPVPGISYGISPLAFLTHVLNYCTRYLCAMRYAVVNANGV